MDKHIYLPESSSGLPIPGWLTRVSYSDSLEENFEEVLYTHAKSIFPDFHCLSFKIKIESDDGATIPDFVLIAKDYSKWAVGEVELVSHNLTEHVLPQIEKFRLGKYDDDGIAVKLCEKYSTLDSSKVRDLFLTQEPEVIVVANEFLDDWRLLLKKRGARYLSLEVYKTSYSHRVIHVCGETTAARLTKIANGIPGPSVSGMNTIALDRRIPEAGESVSLVVNGALVEWAHVSNADKSMLMATKSFNHLQEKYTLFTDQTTGTLLLK